MCIDCYNSFDPITSEWLKSFKGHLKDISSVEIEEKSKMNKEENSNDPKLLFQLSKSFSEAADIDEAHELIRIRDISFTGIKLKINESYVHFSDIVGCELIEDNVVVSNTGLTGGIVGGALFGATGAVVGTIAAKNSKEKVSELGVSLYTNDLNNPQIFVKFAGAGLNKNTDQYRKLIQIAREFNAAVSLIVRRNEPASSTVPTSSLSNADEIRKYKQLFDDGIITQEEFETQKKKLLG